MIEINKDQIRNNIVEEIEKNIPEIKNMNSGGVLRTFIEVVSEFIYSGYKYLEELFPNIFSHSSSGKWLDLHADQMNLKRHEAQKTLGILKLRREHTDANIEIPKNRIFSTKKNNKGEIFRYHTKTDYIFEHGETTLSVWVESEKSGSQYNVPPYTITEIITPIVSVQSVSNDTNWINQMGTDLEKDESLRERCLNQWKGLNGANKEAYIHWVKMIPGINQVIPISSSIETLGTVEIYVLGEKNIFPDKTVLEKIREHIDVLKPIGTQVVIKTPNKILIPLSISIKIDKNFPKSVGSNEDINIYSTVYREKIRDFFEKIIIGNNFVPSKLISYLFEEIKETYSVEMNYSDSIDIDDLSIAVLDNNNLSINVAKSEE